MSDEIVPELAWQMGRPIRYPAASSAASRSAPAHMIAIAESALAPIEPEPKDGFRRYVRREPLGIVLVIAPWNYPYLTAVNYRRSGADGRQRRDAQACRADAAGRRALPDGDGHAPGCRRACSRTSCSSMTTRRS